MLSTIHLLTQAEALARLQSMLSWEDDPALSPAEVLDLLASARTVDYYGAWPDALHPWAPSTTLAVGAQLVPTTRNGHYYQVTVSDGQAGAAEPAWPLTSAGLVTADGVTYQEAGIANWRGAWNLRLAAAEGWRWKASKVAARFDFGSDVSDSKRSQIHKQCLEMAKVFSAGINGSMELCSPDLYDPVIGNLNGAV